jgi:conjugative transfer region lipoprotein (TIGR03751 family)
VAVVANSNGSLGTVGISGNEAMGRILAGGVRDMADWVNKLYGQAFAAVYVQPGAKVAVHLEQPLNIDYDAKGRRVNHRIGGKPMRRIWIESAAALLRGHGAGRLRHQQGPTAAARRQHHARRLAAGDGRERCGEPADRQAARQLLDARQSLRRPLTEIDVQATPAANAAYTRTASQRNLLGSSGACPNPDLVMYVFPHLAGTDPVPVPGYSTVFPLYQRVQYAMPGERVEDY